MKNNEKFLIVLDADATLVNSEKMQGAFYRDALSILFKDNPEAIKKLDSTLSSDEEECKEWYYNNLMGRGALQAQVISENIYPITTKEMAMVNGYVDKRLLQAVGKDMVLDGAKEMLQDLSKMENVEICIVSNGSAEPVALELLKSKTLDSSTRINGFYTLEWLKRSGERIDKTEMVKQIMADRGITDATHVICVGDGIGDMKMGTNIDENGKNAYRIGCVAAFDSPETGRNPFKDKRAKELLDNGADVVFDGYNGIFDAIVKKIAEVESKNTQNKEKSSDKTKNGSLDLPTFRKIAEERKIRIL